MDEVDQATLEEAARICEIRKAHPQQTDVILDVQPSQFKLRVGQFCLSDIHGTGKSCGIALTLDLHQSLAKTVLLIQGFEFPEISFQLDIDQCGVCHHLFPRIPHGRPRCR